MLKTLQTFILLLWLGTFHNVYSQQTYQTVGIIGSATPSGWDASTPMQQVDGQPHAWTLTIRLVAGELKFRADDAWTVNWGGSGFPSGTGTQDGPNLAIPTTAYYTINFNSSTGAYDFTVLDPATYETVGIIGSATANGWDASTPMNQDPDDAHLWTLTGVKLTDGEAKFRANNAWDVNWGNTTFPEGQGYQNGPNIPVMAGTYDISFNDVSGAYAFKPVDTGGGNENAIVTLIPAFPKDDEEVTIIYDATKGTSDLVDADKVYIHTGVITSGPEGLGWTHVVGNYGQDDGVGLMQPVEGEANKWQITLPSIRAYYDVPEGTPVFRLGMIFRNADGTKTGKSDSNGDIYLNVDPGNFIRFTAPAASEVFVPSGEAFTISATASDVASAITLSIDEGNGLQEVAAVNNAQDITYAYTIDKSQVLNVKVTAELAGETVVAEKEISIQVRNNNQIAELPTGVSNGINYQDDPTKATLVLLAPGKDFVYVVGDFTNWEIKPEYQMNQTPDGAYFWLELDGLTPKKEYVFQYWVEGNIKVGDPYADQVADPFNDGNIPEEVYPGLIDYNRVEDGIATVLQTGQEAYVWKFPEVAGGQPEHEDLVIYELLVRDFLASHSYDDLADTLSYIKRLGANAIELMPIMEFEGNESWGYNPSYAFAPDKYYGTKNDLKAFIDKAHEEGFVVILDMVLNHHFGQSPMVRMYFDQASNQPSAESPWFNQVPTHPFNVGYDFNHESTYTQQYVDDVNRYWLEEYHFDGYRFDLSKGFTQNEGKEFSDVGAWSSYDQSRIDILKRMADQIWETDPDTYVILEHLAVNEEEKVLADYGMMLWANMNHPYNEVINGKTGTNLDAALASTRGWSEKNLIPYMESHDEERLMVRALNEGQSSGSYDIQDLDIALERIKLASAFFYPLPGPKMLWQFGELAYDIPINYNGRTGNKPLPWGEESLEYYQDTQRKNLYKATAAIINLVNDYAEAFEDGEFSWTPTGQLREINVSHENLSATIIGNFGTTSGTITPTFAHTGTWYDFFAADPFEVTSTVGEVTLAPGEFHIYVDQAVDFPEEGLVKIFTPVVTVEPGTFTVDNQIKIVFDASAANPDGTEGLIGADKVYMYAGIVTEDPEGTTLENITGSKNEDNGIGQMTKVPGDNNKWVISLRPREYFNIQHDQTPYRIGMYFRDADGSNVGKGKEGLIFADIQPSQNIVTVDPAAFTAQDEITITFDASRADASGTAGLVGAEKVYMHSGVVTTNTDAPSGGDWTHVVGNYGQDDGVGQMTKVPGDNALWTITLTPRDYYGLNDDTPVYYLAMVFRNADGSAEGKATGGSDIFIRVSQGSPEKPTALEAVDNGNGQILLSWKDNASDELGFILERATDNEVFQAIATLEENTTQFTDAVKKDGVTLAYRIKAISAYEPDSEYSDTAKIILPLAAPENLQAKATQLRQVSLTWDDLSDSETGYVIERAYQIGKKKSQYMIIASLGKDASSYEDHNIVPAWHYSYRVKAVKDTASSDYSNEVTIRPVKDYIKDHLEALLASIVIYPNPTDDVLTIKVDTELTGVIVFRIVDMRGRTHRQYCMKKSNGLAEINCDVAGLKPGIYLVEATHQGVKTQLRLQIK